MSPFDDESRIRQRHRELAFDARRIGLRDVLQMQHGSYQ
jgi:hypothetical protein